MLRGDFDREWHAEYKVESQILGNDSDTLEDTQHRIPEQVAPTLDVE